MTRIQELSQAVLDRMVEQSVEDLWSGSLSELIFEVTGSKSYYSPVVRLLRGAQALTQIKRGGGTGVSIWHVTNVDLTDAKFAPIMNRRRSLETRVADLEKLVGGVDVPQALRDIIEERGEKDAGE